MIDEKRTYEKFGYKSSDLKPHSNKNIIAVCNGCGGIREIQKNGYRNLCKSCAAIISNLRRKGVPRSDKTKKKISDANKGKKHTDKTKKRMSEAHKGMPLSEETKRKLSESHKGEKHWNFGKHHSEETRRKNSEAHKGVCLSEETRRKISEAHKGVPLSDETKRKVSAGHQGIPYAEWDGFVSFGKYCQKFNETFKESIREKFGRICFLCPKTEAENGRKLCVHHVNYDKSCLCEGVKCEFVPLCNSCHSATNNNREHWENFIMKKLKEVI